MNANLGICFNNKYNIKLIDSITGKIKQQGTYSNIVTKNLLYLLGNAGSTTESAVTPYQDMLSYIACGNGTTPPAFNDTTLTNQLWLIKRSSVVTEWIGHATLRSTAVFEFPATSSYVGTVSEVGLYGVMAASENNKMLCTHALLTDSEGQSINFVKSDTDILKITVIVEASLKSNSDDFSFFSKPYLLCMLLGASTYNGNAAAYTGAYKYGYPSLFRFYGDLDSFVLTTVPSHSVSGDTYLTNNNTVIVSAPNTEGGVYLRTNVLRLLSTNVTSERYFKAVALPGIGYWKLPNESIFPTYTIENIPIGTGDGVTTQFENPLCYFKADTEKVYKNGIQLTRDVDYTINNIGNKDCLPEVSEFLPLIKVTSQANSGYSSAVVSLFHCVAASRSTKSTADFNRAVECPGFSVTYPVYLEYEEEVTLNCLKSTGLNLLDGAGYSTTVPAGTAFYVDASADGITYNEVGSVTTTDTTGAFALDFPDTTAKYWRVRTSAGGSSRMVGITSSDGSSNTKYITLNRKDPYITFTVAPEVDDVLTMDVGMDVIMKNDKFVVDVSMRLDINVG